MIDVDICDKRVPYECIATHWSGWNKARTSDELLPYCLTASVERVVTVFGQYWAEFMEAESEDDGTKVPPGVYQELQAIDYPSLAAVLRSHPDFFCRIAMQSLQTELLGFLVQNNFSACVNEGFFLQSMEKVGVSNNKVAIYGTAVRVSPTKTVCHELHR